MRKSGLSGVLLVAVVLLLASCRTAISSSEVESADVEVRIELERYPSGQIKRYYWVTEDTGTLHGLAIEYYQVEGEFSDDVHSYWSWGRYNGAIKTMGSYYLGQKHGVWLEWDSTGWLLPERAYHEGVRVR